MFLFALLAIFIFTTSVHGADRIELTLEQALRLAESNALDLIAAGLDVETGDANVRQAYAAALPQLGASGGVTHFMIAPTYNIPGLGRLRFVTYNDLAGDLSLTQPLWLAGKVGLALKAAKTYRKIARQTESAVKARLKSEVVQDYFGVALARELVTLTEESYQQALRHAATARAMYESGLSSEFDTLRARVAAMTLEPELARAKMTARLSELKLITRLGLDPNTEIEIATRLEPPEQAGELGEDSRLYKRAVKTRAELQALSLQRDLNSIAIMIERRSIYLPNLYLGLNYRVQAQEDNFKLGDYDWTSAFTWTLQAQLPLFDGFATQAKVQLAKITLRRSALQQQQFLDGLRLEVSAAVHEYRRATQQIESQRAAMRMAEKALAIANTRFEEGLGTELEVLDAQLALHNARLGYLQGLYDMKVAEVEFARIVENDDDFSRVSQ